MPEPVRKRSRATLPGASELFRTTDAQQATPAAADAEPTPVETPSPSQAPAEPPVAPSGRVRHDEKITVYFSSEELFALEDARTDLRRQHGISVDRGRIVRAAVALALAGLTADGADSALVEQLNG